MKMLYENIVMYLVTIIFIVLTLIFLSCNHDDEHGGNNSGSTTSECFDEPEIMTTADGVAYVRTPDACFNDLPDFPYEARYVEIDGLRQAYVDEGPTDGPVVLLLHGQPSWSYLYRTMIPVLADAGYRVIAMDHLGMGRSDKPIDIASYSYLGHNDRLERFIEALDLHHINLFVQDWGSVIGLRVAGLNPNRFASIAVGNGILPVFPEGIQPFPPVENPDQIEEITAPFASIPAQQVPFYDECELLIPREDNSYFGVWMTYALKAESFRASEVVEAMTWFDLSPEEEAAYDAPFPSRTYMAGPRVFPSLINEVPGTTEQAWAGLMSFERPFLTLWAVNDPGALGSCEAQQLLVNSVPGATDQSHDRLAEASHFLQDDQGEEIAWRLVDFYSSIDSGPNNVEGALRVGFEIIEMRSPNSMRAWISSDITQAEFDALELPAGWFKNQPREGEPDASRFYRSPGEADDGEFLEENLFGFNWWHSATITQANLTLDEQGFLNGATVAKFHEVTFDAGRTIAVLFSPDGTPYVRITRDANRTSDEPSIPNLWRLIEYTTPERIVIQLPEETLVIRTDNEDSFQGPVPEFAVAF